VAAAFRKIRKQVVPLFGNICLRQSESRSLAHDVIFFMLATQADAPLSSGGPRYHHEWGFLVKTGSQRSEA